MNTLVLVLILVFPPEAGNRPVGAQIMGEFKTIEQCFRARESLATALFGTPDGYFPVGSQALCIPIPGGTGG